MDQGTTASFLSHQGFKDAEYALNTLLWGMNEIENGTLHYR